MNNMNNDCRLKNINRGGTGISPSKKHGRTSCLMLIGGALLMLCNSVFALNTTYYVDPSGNDANNGTNTSTPWKTLSKVHATTFGAGDQILFKAGGSWVGTLAPQGSGTATASIVVGRYGSGADPAINAAGDKRTVFLYNQQYWDIGHLNISNYSAATPTTERVGVDVIGEDYQVGSTTDLINVAYLRGIRLHDLYIHDVNGKDSKFRGGSAGIKFSVIKDETVSVHRVTAFDSITIENNDIEDIKRTGIVTTSDWFWRPQYGGPETDPDNVVGNANITPSPWIPHTNVIIRYNWLYNMAGDGIVPHNTTGALVEHNFLSGYNLSSSTPNAGMWTYNGDYTLYQYNTVTGGADGAQDGMPWDFDHGSKGIIYQYNFSYDNDGGALLLCADGDTLSDGGVFDGVFRYNISINDRLRLISTCNSSNVYNTQIYNNTFYVGSGLSTSMLQDQNAGSPEATLKNNIFYNLGSGGYVKEPAYTYSSNVFGGNNTPTTTTIPDASMLVANPLFVNSGSLTADGLKLQSSSPALSNGALIASNGGKDYWGKGVSASALPNRGAFNGYANLISDPGFESGSLGSWSTWNTVLVVASNGNTGSYSLKLQGSPESAQRTITGLKPSTSYTLKAYVKMAGGVGTDSAYIGATSFGGTPQTATTTSTSYVQLSITFTTGASNTSAVIYIEKDVGTGNAYGDDFSLVEN